MPVDNRTHPAGPLLAREAVDVRPSATFYKIFRRSAVVPRNKLTPLQESEARRIAAEEAKKNKKTVTRTDEEKAVRKERIEKAKDALTRSVGVKGDHVTAGRVALKSFLSNMNEPNQPDDSQFEALIEAPFKAPPKKKTNERY